MQRRLVGAAEPSTVSATVVGTLVWMTANDAWRIEAYVASLTSVSPATLVAYTRDVGDFVEWAERGGSLA